MLTVTDDRGVSSQATGTASVTEPVAGAVAFGGADSVGGSASADPAVTIPASTGAGDTLLLFVSNGSSRTPAVPAGWASLGTEIDNELRTDVYWRQATAGDAGQTCAGGVAELCWCPAERAEHGDGGGVLGGG